MEKQEKRIKVETVPAKKKKTWKKKLNRWLSMNVVPPFAQYWMIVYDFATLAQKEKRLTKINIDPFYEAVSTHKGVIIAFWHNRLMFGPTAYQYCKGRTIYVMVSRSRDGDMIAEILNRMKNFEAVRGGSGKEKGGQEALQDMIELGKARQDIAITPDGPLGPRYKVKRGVIDLAKATGMPIYPAGCSSSKYFQMKSWDRTLLPVPGSRVIYKAGETMYVPADADEEMIEQKRAELEKQLVELTEFCDHYFD